MGSTGKMRLSNIPSSTPPETVLERPTSISAEGVVYDYSTSNPLDLGDVLPRDIGLYGMGIYTSEIYNMSDTKFSATTAGDMITVGDARSSERIPGSSSDMTAVINRLKSDGSPDVSIRMNAYYYNKFVRQMADAGYKPDIYLNTKKFEGMGSPFGTMYAHFRKV